MKRLMLGVGVTGGVGLASLALTTSRAACEEGRGEAGVEAGIKAPRLPGGIENRKWDENWDKAGAEKGEGGKGRRHVIVLCVSWGGSAGRERVGGREGGVKEGGREAREQRRRRREERERSEARSV